MDYVTFSEEIPITVEGLDATQTAYFILHNVSANLRTLGNSLADLKSVIDALYTMNAYFIGTGDVVDHADNMLLVYKEIKRRLFNLVYTRKESCSVQTEEMSEQTETSEFGELSEHELMSQDESEPMTVDLTDECESDPEESEAEAVPTADVGTQVEQVLVDVGTQMEFDSDSELLKNRDCPVCLDTFSANKMVLLPCSHWMCRTCSRHLSRLVCPMCRTPITMGIRFKNESNLSYKFVKNFDPEHVPQPSNPETGSPLVSIPQISRDRYVEQYVNVHYGNIGQQVSLMFSNLTQAMDEVNSRRLYPESVITINSSVLPTQTENNRRRRRR